ncbi:hypothetical protein EDC96DRAFT_597400 [Choanephora cucurbitarum]|nr:hypothetical protein EDC96DRAFT_597400 [Choanephora cucurbitarum]
MEEALNVAPYFAMARLLVSKIFGLSGLPTDYFSPPTRCFLALIANSLILSRLWHILRVTSLPDAVFNKVRSLISQFMNRQVFPKLSFAGMCRPRGQGGLGLLDPRLEDSILLSRLVDWLIHCTSPPTTEHWSHLDYRLAFVFPSLRYPSLTGFHSVFSLLFKALDALPRSFESIVVSPATCLCLPLSEVFIPPQNLVISPTLLRLPCSLLYFFDSASQRLQPKSSPQLTTHPTLCKRFLSQVRSNLIKLQSFFVKACIPPACASIGSRPFVPHTTPLLVAADPLVKALGFIQDGDDLLMSSKDYRSLLGAHANVSRLPSGVWKSFWKLPLSHSGRNGWYRLPLDDDTLDHFLWLCPIKLPMWSALWPLFFKDSFSIAALSQAFTSCNFPVTLASSPIADPSSVFGSILVSIWRAHWAFVFSNTPFVWSSVVADASRQVSVSQQEHVVKSGSSHAPLFLLE